MASRKFLLAAPTDATIHLQRISRLLALLATKEMKQIDQVAYLNGVGFNSAEIAEMLQTSQNTIDVTLSRLRTAKKKRSRGE